MSTTHDSAHGLLTVHLTQFIINEYIMNVTSDTSLQYFKFYRYDYYVSPYRIQFIYYCIYILFYPYCILSSY